MRAVVTTATIDLRNVFMTSSENLGPPGLAALAKLVGGPCPLVQTAAAFSF
jgi:hypothetical protein